METHRCPQCQKTLPPDSPEGLCPECLLKGAFHTAVTLDGSQESLQTQTINSAAGTRVKYFGDYELLEEIARGGMGVVWKARQNSLNRIVAVKMILAGKLARSIEVQRFLREAEAAANLQHPNIVAIHEVGEHEGQHYFSMDYVDGRNLGALAREGPLPPQQAARYVKAIALAIHFAHQRGTLHRDLKPQNVLIDAHDEPRITDFGLAKFVEDDSGLTRSGALMGSPSYMSPEQASSRHDQVGPASDVYAIGAILYELITGRPPFREATAMATLQKVIDVDPIPPRKLNANIPQDLETICLKCLEKSPQQRYPSARELAEDVQRFLDQEPIHARPASPVRKVISWCRRHPTTLAGATALVVVGLAVFAVLLVEENAFLRAQRGDPGLSRQSGSRIKTLDDLNSLSLLIFMTCIFALGAIRKHVHQLSWEDLFDPLKMMQPYRSLTSQIRLLAVSLGLSSVVYGLFFLGKIIQAYVWEGDVRSTYVLGVWVDVWFGLTLIWLVVRDYQRNWFGPPNRTLPPEKLAEIRSALLEFDVSEAIRLYRGAVPEAGVAEARDYVVELAADLQSKEPGKFVRPSFSFRKLNWALMTACAGIELAVIGVVWTLYSPMQTEAALWQFLGGFAFALGILIGTRLNAFWKRMLAMLPGLILIMIGSEVLRQAGSPHFFTWNYMIGLICGFCLMASGYSTNRTEHSAAKY